MLIKWQEKKNKQIISYFKLTVSRKQTHALDKKIPAQVGVILPTR